ncbi:hypothetical protein E2C01_026802 [Portunus trituberculatus]|uniref:Uncharacterized protein n=1 Tax=Portunus trituberculatus TaxID=210409 RepID=A0A5B7EH28_PORTR|nr:hypothetical protein [Portunus trituberculatus]
MGCPLVIFLLYKAAVPNAAERKELFLIPGKEHSSINLVTWMFSAVDYMAHGSSQDGTSRQGKQLAFQPDQQCTCSSVQRVRKGQFWGRGQQRIPA